MSQDQLAEEIAAVRAERKLWAQEAIVATFVVAKAEAQRELCDRRIAELEGEPMPPPSGCLRDERRNGVWHFKTRLPLFRAWAEADVQRQSQEETPPW